MKIAIAGAGLAGLSLGWHLMDQSKGSIALDIFDHLPIGEGTSGLASGLLHAYTGTRAQLNWQGHEMMQDAHNLLTAASSYAETRLITSTSLLRVALSTPQILAFQENAKKYRDCSWLGPKQVQALMPQVTLPEDSGGLLLREAMTVDVKQYLKALMQAIIRLGGRWRQEEITDPGIFADYDRVIIAMGSDTTLFTILGTLPMTNIKGQSLEVKWPEELAPLPMSLMGESHIVMRPGGKSCLIGATFEREFTTKEPNPAFAIEQLLNKTAKLLPSLKGAEVLDCYSGIRACPTHHKPLLGRLNERFWFCTGLCAKGLLYHGFLGKKMARALLADQSALIPKELYHHIPLP